MLFPSHERWKFTQISSNCVRIKQSGSISKTLYNKGDCFKNLCLILQLETQLHNILPRVPIGLQEALIRLVNKEPRQRPTSQLLALIKYFSDPPVHALQFLDVISMKDPTQKAHFYRHSLKEVLPYIPRVNSPMTQESHLAFVILSVMDFCLCNSLS